MYLSLKEETKIGFGPHLYGANLLIDSVFNSIRVDKPTVIDVETDEKDNFVGLALCQDKDIVYYYSKLDDELKILISKLSIIGHNIKFDLKQMYRWGIDIKPEQLYFDTCLASYVVNTTKESHHLKDLAKEILGYSWPTYKEMVGSGRSKITLDKQSVERVANYCGMDALATYVLYERFKKVLTQQQRYILEQIETPVARVLFEMEIKGVKIDVPYLQELDKKFYLQMEQISAILKEQWSKVSGDEFNVNSNRQVATLLEHQGAVLPTTDKGNKKVDKATLEQWKHLPAVEHLLTYSKIEKLYSTYTQGLLQKQKDGIIYGSFNQITKNDKGSEVGISTNRLSSSDPNLQNIPSRTQEGQLIEKAFIPREGKQFIYLDFSQIEPRLAVHFTGDKFLLNVYNNNRDLYDELVSGTGRSRQDGKTFMLALLYGAQSKKLASVFKCTEEESERILQSMWAKLPGVVSWINRTKYEARQKKGVFTLNKRFIPVPGILSKNRYEVMHWERVAVNSVIQGSAAEIMKMSLIALKRLGRVPVLTVHDSFLIESDSPEKDIEDIKSVLNNIVKLRVPLKVEGGIGNNWLEAK